MNNYWDDILAKKYPKLVEYFGIKNAQRLDSAMFHSCKGVKVQSKIYSGYFNITLCATHGCEFQWITRLFGASWLSFQHTHHTHLDFSSLIPQKLDCEDKIIFVYNLCKTNERAIWDTASREEDWWDWSQE